MHTDETLSTHSEEEPLFSVVIPAYNARDTIPAAVDSVLQNDASHEVLVVDDGSRDPVASDDLPPGPVRVVRLPTNGGTAHARNHGITAAKGRWIAFLDADDTWEPHRLDAARSCLAERNVAGLVTDTIVVSSDGSSRVASPTPNADGLMHLRTGLVCGALILSAPLFERVGLFDPRWRIQEDVDLWLRIILSGTRIAYLPRPAYVYRLNDEGKTLGRDPVLGLHEFRDIHVANALRRGVRARDRAILLVRAIKWERAAVPYHLARLRRSQA